MRLDKYLKVSRILKRRTVAKELAEQERVYINNRKAKASSEVKIGDIIEIHFGNRELTVKVLDTPKQVNKQDALQTFEIIEEKYIPKD